MEEIFKGVEKKILVSKIKHFFISRKEGMFVCTIRT